MVPAVSNGARTSGSWGGRVRGFALCCDDADALGCVAVRGFAEALRAAVDPRVPLPARLVVVEPDAETAAWLDAWAEDTGRVRRRVLVSRIFDRQEVWCVVTMAAHGFGVETSLAVESVRLEHAFALSRSGVHPKAEIAAALERHDAAE